MTHVFVQGANSPPPRSSEVISLPLANLWTRGIDPNTRRDVLQILSRIAVKQLSSIETQTEAKPVSKEVSDE